MGVVSFDRQLDDDPFDAAQYRSLPKRKMNQVLTTASYKFKSKFELSTRFNFSTLYDISYMDNRNPRCDVNCGKWMSGNDFQLMIRYYLKK